MKLTLKLSTAKMILKAFNARESGELRPSLNHVLIRKSNEIKDSIKVVSSNGTVLVEYSTLDDLLFESLSETNSQELLVNEKFILNLKNEVKLVGKKALAVTVILDESYFRSELDFPRYESVMPKRDLDCIEICLNKELLDKILKSLEFQSKRQNIVLKVPTRSLLPLEINDFENTFRAVIMPIRR